MFGCSNAEIADVGEQDYSVLEDEANQTPLASSTPNFGASQVVIVRDQDQKKNLPEFMKNMLCLTVYECKGLEFDDVILFNFFSMGEIRKE